MWNKNAIPKILFLCTGNSCRSQMAEGIFRYYFGGMFEVMSAGIHPTVVNPYSIRVMKEIDIDISGYVSKSVSRFTGEKIDTVITVCDSAKKSCPYFPGDVKRLHWHFEDPADKKGSETEILNEFRRIRNQIHEKIVSEFSA